MITQTLGATAALAALLGVGGYTAYEKLAVSTVTAPTTIAAPATTATQTQLVPVLVRTPGGRAAQPERAQSPVTHHAAPTRATDRAARAKTKAEPSAPRRARAADTDGRRRPQATQRTSAASATPLVWYQPKNAQKPQLVRVEVRQTGGRTAGGEAGYQLVAMDGSIILVGDDAELIANTGDTSSSGVVALGVDGSSLTSGASRSSGAADDPNASHANGSLAALRSGSQQSGGSAAISGFEDHSISVLGDGQIVTYDDSNVFIDRNGRINANTGDTDSSGLNAVDVHNSRVRAGNSGDGEDSEEAADEEEQDEADDAEDTTDATPDPAEQEESSEDDEDTADATPDPAEQEESTEDDETPAGVDQQSGRSGHRASVTDEGASTAEGDETFVVGADGFDDVSIRTRGNQNLVSYDDSNVVIGGTGDVNAQVGDADTGGTVVMGIHDSDVSGGCEGDLCDTE
ncbi:MAG TPA: hypothetical protein VFU98_14475 [Microlunatus sp.]|nr:hypothetical protein [Microlunatus sp.]